MYENKEEDILKAKHGNKIKMQQLLDENTGLIWSIVRRFKGRGYEQEDLYQIGAMGFIKAIQRFDETYQVKLSTYAVPYILGEIKRFLRDDGMIKVSRSVKELNNKIRELQKEYMVKQGKEITILELSKELGITKEEIAAAMEASQEVSSINSEIYEDSNGKETLIDQLSNHKDEAGEVVEKISLREMVENLNERDKQIILLRYYKEKTQTQVAKILGITQVQVSRIEKKILENMREKLIC